MQDQEKQKLLNEFVALLNSFASIEQEIDGTLQKTIQTESGVYNLILQRNIVPEFKV